MEKVLMCPGVPTVVNFCFFINLLVFIISVMF